MTAARTMTAAHTSVDIPALKARYPLAGVVEGSGVKFKGRGRVRQGLCPFHKETEGSFTAYADTERWYCFGCGLGGDVFDFIRRLEGLTLPEALRRLDARPVPRHGNGSWAPTDQAKRTPSDLTATTPVERDPALLTAAMR